MNKKTQTALTGAALAMAMANMAGYANAAEPMAGADSTDLVHCYGVNACKGHNDCKTADNACADASCQRQWFVAMPSKAVVMSAVKSLMIGWAKLPTPNWFTAMALTPVKAITIVKLPTMPVRATPAAKAVVLSQHRQNPAVISAAKQALKRQYAD